ncbi:MAG: Lrp/AsnC family transcriptional regulator [Rhodospirillales bacterium]|jgi:DNA-binding Lrp family transcriptional regulator|nr:Lrp/AsnC family transcriptional regulator [Rhodospirillales bacterium]
MTTTDKDEHMIALLRENGRMSVSELARRLHVSRTAAQARLDKLERSEIIKGYSVRLSAAFAKTEVRALVMIKSPPFNRAKIEASLTKITNLASLFSISGVFDLAAVISAQSVEALDTTIDKIGNLEGVEDTQSSIILSTKVDR